eukprot:1063035-Pelagomonas_calceolata.AAC.4
MKIGNLTIMDEQYGDNRFAVVTTPIYRDDGSWRTPHHSPSLRSPHKGLAPATLLHPRTMFHS